MPQLLLQIVILRIPLSLPEEHLQSSERNGEQTILGRDYKILEEEGQKIGEYQTDTMVEE